MNLNHLRLSEHKPGKYWARRWLKRSAVCLIMHEERNETQVMMIKRAEREGDPWSGHMAFPGGKFDDALDNNILQTAIRETYEEVGVPETAIGTSVGRLSDVVTPMRTRKPMMVVTPFLYQVAEKPPVQANEEVAEVVWLPLSYFANEANRQSMRWKYRGVEVSLPCYHYQTYKIWGLSLKMLDELVGILK